MYNQANSPCKLLSQPETSELKTRFFLMLNTDTCITPFPFSSWPQYTMQKEIEQAVPVLTRLIFTRMVPSLSLGRDTLCPQKSFVVFF
jgi:hypothetical protein